MRPKNETSEDVKRWFLREAARLWPLALGSLSLRHGPCIRDHCSACAAGEGHGSYALSGRMGPRRTSLYVPEELVPEVQQAVVGDLRLKAWVAQLKHFSQLTQRVLEQTQARVIEGNTHFKDKVLSLFEERTEAIRKGKAAKPTEFGKMVKIQEAEHQIITDYEVFEKRPVEADLLLPSIETHQNLLDRLPQLVAADAGFFSADNQTKVKAKGVEKLAVPNQKTRSKVQRAHQRQRWFKRAQRWRVGCEGRISVLKRKHGLLRCRYHGMEGIQRWVGLGAIANNLIQIGKRLAPKPVQAS